MKLLSLDISENQFSKCPGDLLDALDSIETVSIHSNPWEINEFARLTPEATEGSVKSIIASVRQSKTNLKNIINPVVPNRPSTDSKSSVTAESKFSVKDTKILVKKPTLSRQPTDNEKPPAPSPVVAPQAAMAPSSLEFVPKDKPRPPPAHMETKQYQNAPELKSSPVKIEPEGPERTTVVLKSTSRVAGPKGRKPPTVEFLENKIHSENSITALLGESFQKLADGPPPSLPPKASKPNRSPSKAADQPVILNEAKIQEQSPSIVKAKSKELLNDVPVPPRPKTPDVDLSKKPKFDINELKKRQSSDELKREEENRAPAIDHKKHSGAALFEEKEFKRSSDELKPNEKHSPKKNDLPEKTADVVPPPKPPKIFGGVQMFDMSEMKSKQQEKSDALTPSKLEFGKVNETPVPPRPSPPKRAESSINIEKEKPKTVHSESSSDVLGSKKIPVGGINLFDLGKQKPDESPKTPSKMNLEDDPPTKGHKKEPSMPGGVKLPISFDAIENRRQKIEEETPKLTKNLSANELNKDEDSKPKVPSKPNLLENKSGSKNALNELNEQLKQTLPSKNSVTKPQDTVPKPLKETVEVDPKIPPWKAELERRKQQQQSN